jgi:hypothetical protein
LAVFGELNTLEEVEPIYGISRTVLKIISSTLGEENHNETSFSYLKQALFRL